MKRQLNLNGIIRAAPNHVTSVLIRRKRHQICAHTEERPREDTARRHCKSRTEEKPGEARPTHSFDLGLLASGILRKLISIV